MLYEYLNEFIFRWIIANNHYLISQDEIANLPEN